MSDPIHLFTTVVLLMSAAYIVTANLQFRRQWPATVARNRDRLASMFATLDPRFAQQLHLESELAGIEKDRSLMVVSASLAGAIAGAMAGVLFNIALMVLSAPPRTDHSFILSFVGALFGAVAFGILAAED